MRRRQFIGVTATALTASGVLSTVAAAGQQGHLPNEQVPHTRVHPFGDDQPVPAGDWIVHRVGWVDTEGGDSTREDVEHFLEVIDLDTWIDDEPVENASHYWGKIQQGDDGRWYVMWEYATPPKPPGEHSFRARGTFTEEHEGISPGVNFDLTGHYQVRPGR